MDFERIEGKRERTREVETKMEGRTGGRIDVGWWEDY